MDETQTIWDRDYAGPGTRTVWDRDWDGPGTETRWDLVPAAISYHANIVWRAATQRVVWLAEKVRIVWR